MFKIINNYSRIIIHTIHAGFRLFLEYHNKFSKHNREVGHKPIVLIHPSWYCSTDKITQFLEFSEEYEFIILANSEKELSFYKEVFTLEILFINQNAFINENLFEIKENTIRDHDMLVNSGIDKYKRIHLAELVTSVAYISRMGDNICNRSNIKFSKNSIFPNFKDNLISLENYHRLTRGELTMLSATCLAGGIFSAIEGACYASSEYLLCGLPVITTKCKGGREIWYNSDNSIYCEDTPESVAECMEIVKQKLKDGSFNRQKIREDHIKLQDKFRNELTHYIIKKLKEHINNEIDFTILKQHLSF